MRKFFLLLSLSALTGSAATAQQLAVLTDNGQLAMMTDVTTPGNMSPGMAITGVPSGMEIVGIDYRPNTGQLYGLAYNKTASTNNAQIIVIDPATAVATGIGTPITLSLGTAGIGFDFNPAVDRIRVVAENGMNYRLHPVTGALVATDGNLDFAATDVNAAATPFIAACGYTNSYIGSESTTLFNYDRGLDVLVSQVPPNNGTLNTIGSAGINVNAAYPTVGMDIYFDPVTKTNMAMINANVGSDMNDHLYSIDLSTGQATSWGSMGMPVRDIAAVITRDVPATYTGALVYGLTKVNSNLVSFSTDDPTTIRSIKTISGLTNGHRIAGMDVRPVDRNLYALGYNDTTMNFAVYWIDTATGMATKIGTGGTMDLGTGEVIGFDFNPTVDRIRVTATNDSSYRLHPETGSLVATDTSFAYAAGDVNFGADPHVGAIAYINSYRGASSTVLYGVDDMADAFVSVVPPNRGVLNTLASNILSFNAADRSIDMDFYYDSATMMNWGFFAANSNGGVNDSLYTIDESGQIALIDAIGWGVQLKRIAVQLTFTNHEGTSTKELAKTVDFKLYPNPAQNRLTLTFGNALSADRNIEIVDISGKVVQQQIIPINSSDHTFDVSALPAGTYFVKSGSAAAKFMKL